MTRRVDASATIAGRTPFACTRCGRTWLAMGPGRCAVCFLGELEPAEARVDGEPELCVPFGVGASAAADKVSAHVASAPFPCADAPRAPTRLVAHWVPVWLVDARAIAHWRADVGFDEQVRSTVERFKGGAWTSEQVKEVRPRWEGRAGTASRWIENVEAPALKGWEAWRTRIGVPSSGRRSPVGSEPILLPDLPVDDAWPTAEPGFRARLAKDVGRACGGQHVRELYLDARWEELRWTWLLLPVWSTSYVDSRGRTRVIRVDGVTGQVTGPIAASKRAAAVRATLWASSGLVVLLMAAFVAIPGILIWPLLLLTAAGGVLGFLLLACALVPFLRVVAHNAGVPEPPDPEDPSAVP